MSNLKAWASFQSMECSPLDGPAKTSVAQDVARDLAGIDQDCSGTLSGLLTKWPLGGSSSKTSPDCCQAAWDQSAQEGTWVSSSRRWRNSGMAWRGECWTLNISESPKDVAGSSLSDVSETSPVPSKFFLSRRVAQSLLTRAGRKGRNLVEPLASALAAVRDE